MKKNKAGIKDDKSKIRWSLIPWKPLSEVVHVLEHGAKKYGFDNWKYVPNARERYKNAVSRHWLGDGEKSLGYINGEKIDPDSGRSHIACIISSLLFLLWFDQNPDKEPK